MWQQSDQMIFSRDCEGESQESIATNETGIAVAGDVGTMATVNGVGSRTKIGEKGIKIQRC